MYGCNYDVIVPTEDTEAQVLQIWKDRDIISSIILIFSMTYDEISIKYGQSDLYKKHLGDLPGGPVVKTSPSNVGVRV